MKSSSTLSALRLRDTSNVALRREVAVICVYDRVSAFMHFEESTRVLVNSFQERRLSGQSLKTQTQGKN